MVNAVIQMVLDWLKKLIGDVVRWVVGLVGFGPKPTEPAESGESVSGSSESD